MREIIRFLERFNFLILFIFLEIISINLLIKHNYVHQYKTNYILSSLRNNILKISDKINEYTRLKKENRYLIEENNKLYKYYTFYQYYEPFDSSNINNIFSNKIILEFIPAHVVNITTNNQYNYITLKAGKKEGITKEMAIISHEGLVGHTIEVSDYFSIVLPIININYQVSAKLKKNNYSGVLTWDGKNYQYAVLKDIPIHANVKIGDTIVTSGFSTIYPEGILIGIVNNISTEEGIFLNIKIKLSTDFKKLCNVQIIKYPLKNEQKLLEQKYYNQVKND